MAIVPDRVKEQLLTRFEESLVGPVRLTLYTKPGSSRLILPAGVGCTTCADAREIAEALHTAAPDKVALDVIDVSRDGDQTSNITEVPTIVVSSDTTDSRIRFQGLPSGTEFAAIVDAVERVSRNEPGLSDVSLGHLAKLTEPLEVMVFATPT
jgi:alkyl hydroperoxide reductase subunit AhpF